MQSDHNTIEFLESEIQRHNNLYFKENSPEISDLEFDQLVEQLKVLRPKSQIINKVNSDLNTNSKKISRTIPMLSLQKCYETKDLVDWYAKKSKSINDNSIYASYKLDGCAVELTYKNGVFFSAGTRGDGLIGEDVTESFNHIDIPKQFHFNNIESEEVKIRGEIVVLRSAFEKYKDKFSNPRNMASGLLKNKELYKYKSVLTFFAYEVILNNNKVNLQKSIGKLNNKFLIPEFVNFTHLLHSAYIKDSVSSYEKSAVDLDYDTDGIVFRFNKAESCEELGETNSFPNYAIAYKFQGQQAETKLEDIKWQTAKSGKIIPVAIVKPISLNGAIIKRVTLHNFHNAIHEYELTYDCTVSIRRSGGVIPYFEKVVNYGNGKSFRPPMNCPACGGKTVIEDIHLICNNSGCIGATIERIDHFCKTMKIDGLGKETLQKLQEKLEINNPYEIYKLTEQKLISAKIGEVTSKKLIKNIEMSKDCEVPVFLSALGISGLGLQTAQCIFNNIQDITEKLKEGVTLDLEFIGKKSATIIEELQRCSYWVQDLIEILRFRSIRSVGPMSGKTFLFTGTLSIKRSEAEDIIKELGGQIANGINKELDYLIVGGDAGSKLQKAEKLISKGSKLKIINQEEFLELATEAAESIA